MTEQMLTPEWLMKHGFEWLADENVPPDFDVDIKPGNSEARLLIEKGIHRNQFCVVMEQEKYTDGSAWYDTAIWMQDDIGCGFNEIPDCNIREWTVERFAALYFALRGEKLAIKADVYTTICAILEANGFQKTLGGMVRSSTGCAFPYDSLTKYTTVTDFQLDWPYSMP